MKGEHRLASRHQAASQTKHQQPHRQVTADMQMNDVVLQSSEKLQDLDHAFRVIDLIAVLSAEAR